jgi:DNA-3-methyladenine glycosylase II
MTRLIYDKKSETVKTLIGLDNAFGPLVDRIGAITVDIHDNHFVSLASTIIAQQVSSKVAMIMTGRFLSFFGSEPDPAKVVKTPDEDMRALGLSKQKIRYLKSLSAHVLDGSLEFSLMAGMEDHEIIAMLTKVTGIGTWTAEMFLIFSLAREDVFSIGDLGLRNGVRKLFGDPDLSDSDILELSHRWRPVRSVASHYLWHIWDNQVEV